MRLSERHSPLETAEEGYVATREKSGLARGADAWNESGRQDTESKRTNDGHSPSGDCRRRTRRGSEGTGRQRLSDEYS